MQRKVLGHGIVRIKGRKKGPTIGFVCNVHGNELSGRKAVHRVLEKYEIQKGSLILIDGNPEAALLNRRYFESDMNRIFTTELLSRKSGPDDLMRAKYLADMIPTLGLDQAIDFHSTSSQMKNPFSVCFPEAEHLAKLCPIVPVYGWPGIIKGTLNEWLINQGVPSLVVETGEHYSTKAVNVAEQVALSVLSHYGLINLATPLKQKRYPAFKVLEFVQVSHADTFTLTRPYASFDKLSPGELIAHDKEREYRVPKNQGLYILMPAIQDNVRRGVSPGAYYLIERMK